MRSTAIKDDNVEIIAAKKLGVPPFAIFQDPSLEDMALKYPITIDELHNIHGVGEGVLKEELVYLFKRYENIKYYDAEYELTKK